LTKSLVGAPADKTLEELYQMKRAKIVLPLYTGPDKLLFEGLNSFEKRKCHIAFVFQTQEQANELAEFAKTIFKAKRYRKRARSYNVGQDESSSSSDCDMALPDPLENRIHITGLITYENIIEKILMREIEDEYDQRDGIDDKIATKILQRITQYGKK
jgi:hypothetical protein